jgi:hypothetical protein
MEFVCFTILQGTMRHVAEVINLHSQNNVNLILYISKQIKHNPLSAASNVMI